MGAKTVTLIHSQREVEIDLSKISIKEYRQAINKDTSVEKSDKILVKCCKGITAKEIEDLPQPDYHQLINFWLSLAMDPLQDIRKLKMSAEEIDKLGLKYGQKVEIARPDEPDDPNSQSASTSE